MEKLNVLISEDLNTTQQCKAIGEYLKCTMQPGQWTSYSYNAEDGEKQVVHKVKCCYHSPGASWSPDTLS